jgi:hypothetical protein
MDKEVMQNLVYLYNHTLHDIADLRKVIKARINSNNAPQTCCTDSGYHNRKAQIRHSLKTDRAYRLVNRCKNKTIIAIFKKVHKDKPDFRPTTLVDFHVFNELGDIADPIRGAFMPVLSEGQETELGWKELNQVLSHAINTSLDIPKGMYLLHHAHISVEDPRLIAYYPSLKHLMDSHQANDPNLRAVKVKLGKYLTAYREALGMTEVQVKEMVEKYNGHLAAKVGWKVDFIEHDDPDGWFKVYAMKGEFASCMTGSESVKLYAHDKSTLRLAYIESGDGKAVARCIVRDEGEDTGWVRLYGESEDARVFLKSWLAINGYPKQTSLEGCLLPLVERNSRYVCPYIDSGNSDAQMADITTIEDKKYLIICGDGEYKCENTDGTCTEYEEDEDIYECGDCGCREHRDDLCYVETEQIEVCNDCLSNNYTYAYNGSYQEYIKDNGTTAMWGYDGYYYTQEGLDHHNLAVCTYDDELYPICEMVEAVYYGVVHIDNATEVDHIDEDKYNTRYVLSDDVHTLSDSSTCHKDDADEYEEEILDEERPRMFVIPATATAVQLYAHN